MTGWKLDYLLDELSLDQVAMFYEYGYKFLEIKSTILINKLAQAFTKSKKKQIGDKPDVAKFEKIYGNKIKRPKK